MSAAEHRNCTRHIYANWRKKHPRVTLRTWFLRATKASRVEEWRVCMEKIKKISPQAYDDLTRDQDPHTWSRAFFRTTSQCESVDNNISETFNLWILEARYKTVINTWEDIRLQVMVRLQKKRNEMQKGGRKFEKRILEKLDKEIVESRHYNATWNGNLLFKIRGGSVAVVVDLGSSSCECRECQLSGMPCKHAVSIIYYMKENLEDYMANWFTSETYLKSYGQMLKPLNGIDLWPICSLAAVEPPNLRALPGRPQNNRKKDAK